jgi:hypothetical protein
LGISILWRLDECRSVKIETPSGGIYISRRDKKRLEYLFRDLVVYNSAGYTLLGSKPASFDSFCRPSFEWKLQHLWHTYFPSNLRKCRAWKTWEKYQHHFNKGDILIWSEQNPWIRNGELIVIASKKHVAQIAQAYEADFAHVQSLDPKLLFKEALNSHDGLLGTLLGYGRSNAWLFHEKQYPLLKPLFVDELNQLFKNKRASLNFTFGWPNMDLPAILMYPNFMAEPSAEETRKLKIEYSEVRKKILEYYEGNDFLEATLRLL